MTGRVRHGNYLVDYEVLTQAGDPDASHSLERNHDETEKRVAARGRDHAEDERWRAGARSCGFKCRKS